jgi:hypothetical protein
MFGRVVRKNDDSHAPAWPVRDGIWMWDRQRSPIRQAKREGFERLGVDGALEGFGGHRRQGPSHMGGPTIGRSHFTIVTKSESMRSGRFLPGQTTAIRDLRPSARIAYACCMKPSAAFSIGSAANP